jgi:hypothetical protein
MEPKGSLPHSQEPATSPYPKPDLSSPCPHPTSGRSILKYPSHLVLVLPSGLLLSDFSTKSMYATFVSCLILLLLLLLLLLIIIIIIITIIII